MGSTSRAWRLTWNAPSARSETSLAEISCFAFTPSENREASRRWPGAADIHRSVAFDHLERLVALGYLEVERRRGLPGKPAKIYRLTAGPVQISHPMRRYDVVAEAFARFLESTVDGTRAIREAGRALGKSIVRPETSSMPAALEPLTDMGADYEAGPGGNVECTNCLFAEVCRRAPSVCIFHAGVIEGLTGMSTEVEPLGFRGEGGCAYRVWAPA